MADDAGSGKAAAPCPICGRRPVARYTPFCSVRCADADLGHWLTGRYRVPGPAADDDDGPGAPARVDPEDGVG